MDGHDLLARFKIQLYERCGPLCRRDRLGTDHGSPQRLRSIRVIEPRGFGRRFVRFVLHMRGAAWEAAIASLTAKGQRMTVSRAVRPYIGAETVMLQKIQ